MLFSAISIMADDGGATNFEDWSYGNIYVKEPNDKIALEKELMVCDMDSVRAYFVFKNTTNDTVTVDCAFPIDVKLPYETGNKGEEIEYLEDVLNRCYSYRVLTILLGSKKAFEPREILDNYAQINLTERVAKLVRQHDKELKLMNISQYNEFVDSLFKDEYRSYIPNCIIEQDGKSVDLLNVGIESTVDTKEIKMQFHFHHKLIFLPNSYSKVSVKYSVESIKQTYEREHRYFYDISTGGTWKDGKINSFMLVLPNTDIITKCDLNYVCLDYLNDYNIAYKQEFRPQEGDHFLFHKNFSYLEHCSDPEPTFEELQSVKINNIKAPSSLSNLNALFDKDRFTSCAIADCQNAAIEFTLTHDAFGPFLYNGTIGTVVTKESYEAAKDSMKNTWCVEGEQPEFYFPEDRNLVNDGVSKIFIENLDSPSDTFSTQVGFSDPRDIPYVFEWNRINDAYDLHFFSAGRYRLSFRECKDLDTLRITELWFKPVSGELIQMINEDRITPYPLFQTLIKDFEYWKQYVCYYCRSSKSTTKDEKDSLIEASNTELVKANDEENSSVENTSNNRWLIIGGVLILLLIGGGVWMIKKK